jgi:hypothetical protein
LLGFGITIGILVIIAVALVLSTRGSVSLLPADTPQGTVQRFLVALQDKDFQKAYSYLSLDVKGGKMPYQDWVNTMCPS